LTKIKTQFLVNKKGITKLSIYAGVLVILLLLPVFGLPIFYMHIFIGVFIYFILSCSLRLVGLSGQGSLGHAGLMCIGAYTSAILSKNLGWTPWLTMVLGALVTLGMAFLIGILICRLRGIYFVMMTLFFGMAILAIAQIFQAFTGGQSGLGQIPPLFNTASKIPYYYFFIILAAICLFIMYRLEFSRIGLTWKAIAQSYSVASSIGINEFGQRILCLATGGFFAGLAGAAFSHYYMTLSLDSAGFQTSMNMFIYMMVGGINSFAGPIIGTAILIIIPAIFRDLKDYVPFIYAAILLVMLFAAPQGLVSLPGKFKLWIGKLKKEPVTSQKEVINRAP
jgi:branched-chain amino acid transport system permease protein